MCMIIFRPSGHELSLETVEKCAKENPDGWGIMLAQNGNVEVYQGMHRANLLALYEGLPHDAPMAIHTRWRTHGAKDVQNLHPFPVLTREEDGRDLYVMHNGVFHIEETCPEMSDTWHWVNGICRPLLKRCPDALEDDVLFTLLEKSADGSRLLFLDGDGKFTYMNEDSWHNHEGCRFSATPPGKGRVYSYYGGKAWGDPDDYTPYSYGSKETQKITAETSQFGAGGKNEPEEAEEASQEAKSQGAIVPYRGETVNLNGTEMVWDEDQNCFVDPQKVSARDMDFDFFDNMNYDQILQTVEDFPEAIANLIYQYSGTEIS